MLSPLPRQGRETKSLVTNPSTSALPQISGGAAPALWFSRPVQRSLALRPADSPSRLVRPSTSEAPAALLPPPPLQLLPGGAIPSPGGSFFPPVDQPLFTAHRKIPIPLVEPPRRRTTN